jgi:isoquinoline 1-oxidoreductase alpha subunit
MSAAVLLADKEDPTDADIDVGMSGNVCRCATYMRSAAPSTRQAERARSGK